MRPAELLQDMTLDGGYHVHERLTKLPGGTGGHFSVCYLANKDGREYFLKATDTTFVRTGRSGADGLRDVLTAFTYERDLLELAATHAMTRVVKVVASGEVSVAVEDARLGRLELPVFYLIFERGNSSLREQLLASAPVSNIDKLKALHHVAVGLRQLHERDVAHQDLKPSNVMEFEPQGAASSFKIADLGCASRRNHPALHDALACAGDGRYAAPEALYEANSFPFERRRFGADLYLLGSLVLQIFTGVTMTAAIQAKLPVSHRRGSWAGPYDQLLPRLVEAFDAVLIDTRRDWPYLELDGSIADRLELVVRQLCCPDPQRRGHPRAFGTVNPLDVNRYIAVFAQLIHSASIAERRGAVNSMSAPTS